MNLKRTRSIRRIAIATALKCLLVAPAAIAQSPMGPPGDDVWRFSVGGGVFSRPKYPGSGDRSTVAVPLVSVNYGRYFLGGTPGAGLPMGIGANLIQSESWRVGVAFGAELDKPRKASDAPFLNGWGDIPATALASVFASYSYQWITVRGAAVSDIGGKDEGTRLLLDLEAKYSPMNGLMLSAGPGVTWASKDYTQTFFGINAAQSVIAGVPQYNTGAGINTLRFSVGAVYRVSAQWNVGARVNGVWLQGDAADSPVTEDKAQHGYGLFVSYNF
jgi:outer membrane protein